MYIPTQHFQFLHYRSLSGTHGGATVAITQVADNRALISIAYCNPNDAFNKKLGRAISSGRIVASLKGRNSTNGDIREIEVEDMDRIKEAVASELYYEMSAADLA